MPFEYDIVGNVVLLITRIIFGIVFLYYGLPKLKSLKSNATDFENMGFKPGLLWGTLVALLETFGSLAIIFGILVPPIALLFTIHMIIGTIWKKTKTEKPFTDWSYDLLLLTIALFLYGFGAGSFSVFP